MALCAEYISAIADAGVFSTGERGGTAGGRRVAGRVEAALCRPGSWLSSGAPAPCATGKRKGQPIQLGLSFVTHVCLG